MKRNVAASTTTTTSESTATKAAVRQQLYPLKSATGVVVAKKQLVLLLLLLVAPVVRADFTSTIIVDGISNGTVVSSSSSEDTTSTSTSTTVEPSKCSSTSHTTNTNPLLVPDAAVTDARSSALLIAHRGASYHLPEHTLPSYRLGLELGADYIETDLVPSSDGVLFAMHSLDLNITTTNVASVFGIDRMWSSADGTSPKKYYAFNFTAAELRTLRVHQRLPAVRSTVYDGLFGIPTLDDMIGMLYDWNTNVLPQLSSSKRAGIYIEFKETEFVMEMTQHSIDIVELFYTSIADAVTDTTHELHMAWSSLLTFCDDADDAVPKKYNEYIVPGVILQSFTVDDLKRVREMWTVSEVPLLVLLMDTKQCYDEQFWFTYGEEYRKYGIAALGCDKACILGDSSSSTATNTEDVEYFLRKVGEYGLLLHPWTIRPEYVYVNHHHHQSSSSSSVYDELMELLCFTKHVHGIFTESVDIAKRVALECDLQNAAATKGSSSSSKTTKTTATNSTSSSIQNTILVGMFSFCMGCIVAWFLQSGSTRRTERSIGNRISTRDDDDTNNDLELT